MKIKENFVLSQIGDGYVVVPVDSLTLDFNGIINLNESGAFLFELMQKGCDRDELVSRLLEEYDVAADTASADVDEFIKKARDADILE